MKKFLTPLLLLIFFAGQINLTWAKHYCGDKLVSSEVTLNTKAKDCCGSDSKKPMDCCEDEIAQSDSDDFFKKSELKTFASPEFVLAYVLSFRGLELGSFDAPVTFDYSPDIPIPDLLVLHQTFLI